ncbi:MAG: CehA/McbA family metallohydrolase [Myxococcaceae bacterium]
MKWLGLVLAVAVSVALQGCQREGCLNGEATCKVPSPCPRVKFSCDPALAAQLKVETITSPTQRPGGWDGLGSVGDVKLSNAFVDVVIANVGTQNFLDPNGGSVLDLSPHGQAKDVLNNLFQVVGVLPRDAAFYTSVELIDERFGPDGGFAENPRIAVQVRGTLDGVPSVPITTRYELNACDLGLRARTEIVNGGTDTQTWGLTDAYYWSGREALPFAPGPGSGFVHPSFGLTTINGVYRTFPYMAAAGHSTDDHVSSFAAVSCTSQTLEGFHSDQISAAGLPRQIVPPRGSLVFERFFAVGDTKGVSGAIDVALEVRKQTQGEQYVTLTGKVERMGGGNFGTERQASVLISEGTLSMDAGQRVPTTQVVPAGDGTFFAQVPVGKQWVIEAHSFGRKQVERELPVTNTTTDLGTFVLPSTAVVTFHAREAGTLMPINAELFFAPATDADEPNLVGTLHGRFATCAPWLGPPPGASPACNRVLVFNGDAFVEVPVGTFDVYAFHGPFWSIEKQTITITGAPQTIDFQLTRLPLKPGGALSADLHVHGAASFDSSIPDIDRVISFAASDLDVIIGTDHDVVHDYADVLRSLGLDGRMSTVIGLETTGHIPFLTVPGYGFPLVIGHYNMWPLKFDPSLPRNGGPFDERVEPGGLFEKTKPLFTGEPLIELNHPWATPEFGRDLGFPRAILMDLRKPLPKSDDGTRMGVYVRTPAGSSFSNDGHHAQEVMNGSDNTQFLQYRAFWHYMLSQGRVRTGTANSDSHSLTDSTVGLPQNLVFTTTTPGANFDIGEFNRALKAGRSMGTNGPVIEASIDSVTPSTTLFKPAAGAKLKLKVSAAPWVPVEEVRVVINGVVVKHLPVTAAADPFATSGNFVVYEGELAISELTRTVSGDAWLVVEAGHTLLLAGDLGGGLDGEKDGMPDTTDNDGNGVVDLADVSMGAKAGPLKEPPAPARGKPGYEFSVITNGGVPEAFTNPFLLDLDGDSAFTAPVKEPTP